MLRLALPANGDLDRDGLPLISCLTVLSAIHCSTGFTLDTSEVYISDINQCLRNARHVRLPKPWWRWWEGWGDGDYASAWDSLRWSWWGGGWVGGRVGWGELTTDPTLWAASWLQCWTAHGLPLLHLVIQSHPTREDAGWKGEDQELACALLSRESPILLVFYHLSSVHPEYRSSVGQVEYVQHIGSQTRLGSGIPMVPVRTEKELMVNVIHFLHNVICSWKRRHIVSYQIKTPPQKNIFKKNKHLL